MVAIAINAVGISTILPDAITITAPTKPPTTAGVTTPSKILNGFVVAAALVWRIFIYRRQTERDLVTLGALAMCGGKRSDGWQLPVQGLWVATGCCRWGKRRKLLFAVRLPTE